MTAEQQQNNEVGWTPNRRVPDNSNALRSRFDDLSKPFNHQNVQGLREIPADEVDGGVNRPREVIGQAREDLKPLSDKAEVILTPTPTK